MKNDVKKNVLQYVSIFVFFAAIFLMFNLFSAKEHKFTYDEFVNYLSEGEITELTIIPRSGSSIYEIKGKLADYEEKETFASSYQVLQQEIMKLFQENWLFLHKNLWSYTEIRSLHGKDLISTQSWNEWLYFHFPNGTIFQWAVSHPMYSLESGSVKEAASVHSSRHRLPNRKSYFSRKSA